MPTELITPYGGELVSLFVPEPERKELAQRYGGHPRIRLTDRSLCDLELLATGAFSPLDRFMGEADYISVVELSRLSNGLLYPIPVTLPVHSFSGLVLDRELALCDQRNNLLAVMRVEEIFRSDREREANLVYGTSDVRHPLVSEMRSWGEVNISGALRVFSLPDHYDFREIRLTPAQARRRLSGAGRSNVVAFQTRNPLHRAHEELTKRAAERVHGALLLHPVVGMTKPGDIDHYTRVRSYRAMVDKYYDQSNTVLALLPLAMRMAGPREALWHALIRRNFGANHLIVGRDHASPGADSSGKPFYPPYAAQELLCHSAGETGVTPVLFSELVYLPEEGRYEESSRLPAGSGAAALSGTDVREEYLAKGRALPAWFTRPECAAILAQSHPPRNCQGFCVWFTGLSASGKSTTAEILTVLLLEHGRRVTLLDGDIVRTQLSQGLGFSREDRDTNIRRIGFVASEIARHGGAVICAAVSPYRAARNECRALFGQGHFVEVFVSTPLHICEQRDPKGMYALARSGQMPGFTGVDDPYEPPLSPEIVLETESASAEENASRILAWLSDSGFVDPS